MGLFQAVANFAAVFQYLLWRKRTAGKPMRNGFAFEQLHYQIADSILMANIIEGADVRMS